MACWDEPALKCMHKKGGAGMSSVIWDDVLWWTGLAAIGEVSAENASLLLVGRLHRYGGTAACRLKMHAYCYGMGMPGGWQGWP